MEVFDVDTHAYVPLTGMNPLNPSTKTIEANQSFTIDTPEVIPANGVQNVVWTTDAPFVATVENGVVTGQKAGTANITATSLVDSSLTQTCVVTVIPTSTTVLAEWRFTSENYPDATGASALATTANPQGVKKLDASGGEAMAGASLVRSHDKGYPKGNNVSGPLDNTNTIKHMALESPTGFWLQTYGWSTPENYVYLEVSTKGYTNLALSYDLRASSSSTPASLKLQYSLDNKTWINVPGGDIETRYPSAGATVERVEYLPVATYDQDKVYLRWTGTSSSTSGRIEFRKIILYEDENADPGDPEETIFTHINIAPGSDPSQLGFAWFTPQAHTPKMARLQLVEASKLTRDGRFPISGYKTYIGVSATGTDGIGNVSDVYNTNKVTVTGLAKNTKYAYRVGDGTNWSNVYTFNTQNPDGAFEVLLVADPQVSSSPFDWWRVAEVMTQTAPNAAFIMSAGDQTNDSNNLLQVEGYVGAPQLRSYPVMATVGNHDNQMSDTYPHVAHLSMMYQWPNDKMKSAAQAGGWDYYFKYGNALFISLNSNNRTALNHEALIKEAIAFYPDATWRIALFHHDIYGGGDHAGSGYGDSASMQATWSPFLDKYDIDVVFNGHDHIYARSKFVKNDTIQKNQMAAILDNPVTQANPGVFVLPNGIQYFGLSAAGDKSYELEMQEWIAFSPGNLNTPEYSVMLVDGDNIVIDTYHIKSSVPYDTITLRKKALKSDLSSLIAGAKALPKNDILAAGWDAFQAEIPKAEAALSGSADQVHNAYVALYEKFFALSTPIDKTELGLLIKEVKATLSKASEGMYEGSYPKGSKKVLQGVLDTAAEQYETRLPVVADYNAAVTALKTQYAAFLASVSTVPITWVVLHDIEATGVNTVDLIGWMNETVTYDWKDSAERYDSNLTKPNVAITGANVSQSKVAGNSDGPRAEPFFGPANKEGGRGDSDGHITDTFVGEWVRYELDVAQAGSYEVKLGAVNTTASAQTILLRDTEQNILATFTVPSGGSLPASWSAAPMIAADKEVYLPAGRYVVELFFKNNGARPSNNTNYAAGTGADIDILTFERKGAGTPPDDVTDLYIHNLPLPAPMAAGAPARQRGWGNSTDEFGHTGGATAAQLKAATHLVLELATNDCPSGSFQIQIVTDYDGYNWNQTEIRESLSQYWDDTAKTLTIPFAELTGYDALRGITDRGWICVSFYSQGWNELCVMKAWLVLDKSYVPETEKPDVNMLNLTLDDLGGQFYAAGNEETEYDWTMLDRNNGLDDGENYLRVASLDTDTLQTASGNEDFTYENIRYFGFQLHIRDTAQSKFLSEGDKATVLIEYKLYKDGALLEQDERSITISYHPDAALSYQIWDNDDFIFPANYREEGSEYEFYYEVKKITSIKVAGSNGGGSGGSGDSSGATVTEPTHKEEIKLSEKTIAKAADAIEEAMEETLEAVAEALEAETGETVVSNVVLDLGVKLPAGVDEVVFTVPAAIAEAIGDAVKAIEEAIEEGADIDFSVTFPLGLAEVSLDLEALASVFGGGEEVSFNIVLVAEDAREDADIDEALADVVGDRPVYSLYITVGGQPVTSFGGGLVTVAIPYTLGKGEDPNAILVWYINKDGELDVMRSYYEDGYVIFTTDHFSSFVIGYNPVTFGDNLEITAGMRPHVTFVASRGLYKGNQRLDGTRFFNPKGNLTYQELAAVLANYQGIGGTLKNYPADHIAWGAAFGIFGDKTFVHAEEVTRADMAYIICNYIKASGLKVDKIRSFTFSDLGGVDKERSNAILALASYGVISGDAGDGGTFRPDAGITREEVAAILAQLVKAFKK